MLISLITLLVISGILCGAAIYAHRRIHAVAAANRTRTDAAATDLLASLSHPRSGVPAEEHSKPLPQQASEGHPRAVESASEVQPDLAPEAPPRPHDPAPPPSIEDEMRNFFGSTPLPSDAIQKRAGEHPAVLDSADATRLE